MLAGGGLPGRGVMSPRTDLAILAATSGHSGVDTIIRNLLPELTAAGLVVDVLKIRRHGPELDRPPAGARVVELGARHVETAFPALVRYLRRQRPTAMLTDKDSVNRMAILAVLLARVDTRLAVRLGTTVSVNLQNKRRWQAALQTQSIRRLYRHAQRVIVPSRGAAADLARVMGVPASRITVLPNPIVHPGLYEAAREPVAEPWLVQRECPVIVAAGSLTPRKDYATLLHAFAALRARRRCRLILIGRGQCRDVLEGQAERLGIAADVRFTGFLANPYPYLRQADLFAHSSRWEGLGIVLVEALALGTPVVATDCPSGPAEILEGGRVGRLVPVGDAAALAEAMAETLDAPPPPERVTAAMARYRSAESALAYMEALGFARPQRREEPA